jgi:hypothetical protein
MEITAVIQEKSGANIVKLDSKKLLDSVNSIKLAFVPSKDLDLATRKEVERLLKRRKIKIDGTDYVIYHDKNVKIHDPPISSGSPNSDAKYYVWDDKSGLLFQFIPKKSKTSCNYHKKGNEKFYNLLGDCYVCFCNGKKDSHKTKFLNGNSFTVKPRQCHQLYTSSKPAINIILMPPQIGRSDHHYLKKCIKE